MAKTAKWGRYLDGTCEGFWNDHFYRMLGYRALEFEHNFENLIQITHPDDCDLLCELFSHCRERTCRNFHMVLRFMDGWGKYHSIIASGATIKDDAGAELLSGTGRIITPEQLSPNVIRWLEFHGLPVARLVTEANLTHGMNLETGLKKAINNYGRRLKSLTPC